MILISASQISTYRDCPRKWAFDKIDKIPREDTPATKFGKEAHTVMEHYGRTGETPIKSLMTAPERAAYEVIKHNTTAGFKEDGIYLEGTDFKGVPAPSCDDDGKFAIMIPESKDLALHGYIDYMDARNPRHIIVKDYKFLKSDRYIKNSEMLAVDPQCLIYSYYAFSVYPQCTSVTFGHEIGIKETPPRHKRTSIAVTKNALFFMNGMRKIFDTCKAIAAEHRKVRKRFKKETSACFMYGGCSYKDKCKPNLSKKSEPRIINKKRITQEVDIMSEVTKTTVTAVPPSGFKLYIDCRPYPSQYSILEHLIADIIRDPDGVPWDSPSVNVRYEEKRAKLRTEVARRCSSGQWAGKNIVAHSGGVFDVLREVMMAGVSEVVE